MTETDSRTTGAYKRLSMPIVQTGADQANAAAVPGVENAIREFVDYVKASEPGSLNKDNTFISK